MKFSLKAFKYDHEFVLNFPMENNYTPDPKLSLNKFLTIVFQKFHSNKYVYLSLILIMIGIYISLKWTLVAIFISTIIASLSFIIAILRMDFKFERNLDDEEELR